jgi:hypothetical protein
MFKSCENVDPLHSLKPLKYWGTLGASGGLYPPETAKTVKTGEILVNILVLMNISVYE